MAQTNLNPTNNDYVTVKTSKDNALIEIGSTGKGGQVNLMGQTISLDGEIRRQLKIRSYTPSYTILDESGSVFGNKLGPVQYILSPDSSEGDIYQFINSTQKLLTVNGIILYNGQIWNSIRSTTLTSVVLLNIGGIWIVNSESGQGAWR